MQIDLGVRQFQAAGGAEKIMCCLAGHLHAAGHAVHVFTYRGQASNGLSVTALRKPAFPRAARDWARGRRLAAALRASRADVTMSEQKTWGVDVLRPGGGLEELYWRAHSAYAHSLVPRRASPKYYFDLRAERNGYDDPRLRRVIVNSNMVAEQVQRFYPRLTGRIAVVYNGSDLCPHDPATRARHRRALCAAHGFDTRLPLLLFVGHEFKRKGLGEAMTVVAQAHAAGVAAQLLVVGRDARAPYLRWRRKMGLDRSIAFAGVNADLRDVYSASDALILPTYHDPFANVTIEALCMGVPVITTRMNGGHEVIGPDAGWVVDRPDDLATMTRAVTTLSNHHAREAYAEAARKAGAAHSLRSKLREMESILMVVAEEKKRDGARFLRPYG